MRLTMADATADTPAAPPPDNPRLDILRLAPLWAMLSYG